MGTNASKLCDVVTCRRLPITAATDAPITRTRGSPITRNSRSPIPLNNGSPIISEEHLDKNDILNIEGCYALNQHFGEVVFKANKGSLSYDEGWELDPEVTWMRPDEIGMVIPSKLLESLRENNLYFDRGNLDDSWLLDAIAMVAKWPHIIEKIMVTKTFMPEGVYAVQICWNGKWTRMSIDDLLPCTSQKKPMFSKSQAGHPAQLCVMLIEKAFAKLFGCYEGLRGLSVINALAMLTGAPCVTVDIQPSRDLVGGKEVHKAMIWKMLSDRRSLRSAVCGVPRIREHVYLANGLRRNHNYDILDVQVVELILHDRLGEPLSSRLLLLHDTRGESEWKEEWSKDSDRWRTVPYSIAQDLKKMANNGRFWIPLESFMNCFWSLEICKYREDWFEERITGHFLTSESDQVLRITEIKVVESTDVVLSLFQNDQRCKQYQKRRLTDLWILVFKKSSNSSCYDKVVVSKRIEEREFLTCEAHLDPGKHIVVCTSIAYWAARDKLDFPTYVLSVHSAKGLSIEDQRMSIVDFASAIIRLVLSTGSKEEISENRIIYRLKVDRSGLIIVAENGYTNDVLYVRCQCTDPTSRTSRNAISTEDNIPPKHRQIVTTMLQRGVNSNMDHQIEVKRAHPERCGPMHVPPLRSEEDDIHMPIPI